MPNLLYFHKFLKTDLLNELFFIANELTLSIVLL